MKFIKSEQQVGIYHPPFLISKSLLDLFLNISFLFDLYNCDISGNYLKNTSFLSAIYFLSSYFDS